jgi:TRAP-type mannitol/chloroaromatic compound transport system permease small subunit
MWPIKLSLFLGAVLITAQGIVEAIRSVILIINPDADVKRSETA